MKHKLIRSATALMLFLSLSAVADTAWITDDLRTGVQKEAGRNSGFAGTLVAGAEVERLEQSSDGEYTHIRTPELDGWVLTRNLTEQPSIRSRFTQQAEELQEAQQSLSALQNTDTRAAEQNRRLREELEQAKALAQKSRDELLSLQRVSENVVEIDSLNRELQDKVVRLEQANLRLTQQNTRLSEQSHHHQMIVGGGLVLGGMVAFWLLSLLRGARRRSTFNDF